MTDINRPLLGEPNAPCRSCGAPLAADQRYCLQCGTRRAEARLPFLDILASQVPQAAAAAQTTTTTTSRGPGGWFGRASANVVAIAGVACLVLALGVGVLIGGLGSDDAPASSPQVITVGGAPAAAAAPAATSAAPAATESAPASTETTPGSSSKSKSSKKGASSSSSDSKATNSTVKNLDKSTGGDYSKKSAKLPKEVGTGGKAPAKDTSGTKIGGGSATEEIG